MISSHEYAPVRPCSSVWPIARGKPAAMPAKMISDMPLPSPRSVICSPSHIRNIVPVTSVTAETRRNVMPGSSTRPGLRLQRRRDANAWKNDSAERRIARVLRDLPLAGLPFLLQRLERRHDHRAELHDDRRRDVRHDPQREDREARQRAAREHVQQAENPALLAAEQLVEHRGVDARHRDVRTDPVDDERAQQEPQAALQVAVLVAALLRRICGCQWTVLVCVARAPIQASCRRRPRSRPSRPASPSGR